MASGDTTIDVGIHVTTSDPLAKVRGALQLYHARLQEAAEAQRAFTRELQLLDDGLRELRRQYHEMEDKK